MNMEIFKHHLLLALAKAIQLFKQIKNGEVELNAGAGFGDLNNDTEIVADKIMGDMFLSFFSQSGLGLGRITVEGRPDFESDDGEGWLTVDPLDGSLNFKSRGSSHGLPMSVCLTLLAKKQGAVFADIILAAVMDLRWPYDLWVAEKQADGHYYTELNAKATRTWDAQILDLRSQILFGEMYYPSNREKIFKAFVDQRGWLRSPGSAAYEMAMVSSGQSIGFICDQQKQHELGAAFALVKGAGGVALDWDGVDLGQREFLFNAQTPVILAANQAIADQILERLHR